MRDNEVCVDSTNTSVDLGLNVELAIFSFRYLITCHFSTVLLV